MPLPPLVKLVSLGELTEQGALITFELFHGSRISGMLSETELRYLHSMSGARLPKTEPQNAVE
jgi:hypothetical protein